MQSALLPRLPPRIIHLCAVFTTVLAVGHLATAAQRVRSSQPAQGKSAILVVGQKKVRCELILGRLFQDAPRVTFSWNRDGGRREKNVFVLPKHFSFNYTETKVDTRLARGNDLIIAVNATKPGGSSSVMGTYLLRLRENSSKPDVMFYHEMRRPSSYLVESKGRLIIFCSAVANAQAESNDEPHFYQFEWTKISQKGVKIIKRRMTRRKYDDWTGMQERFLRSPAVDPFQEIQRRWPLEWGKNDDGPIEREQNSPRLM